MKKISEKALQEKYVRCLNELRQLTSISHGSVYARGPGAEGGPSYQWTRKVKAKTVSVALSKEQYEALHVATQNWKKCKKILGEMEKISRTIIFKTLPDAPRRKTPTDELLGLS